MSLRNEIHSAYDELSPSTPLIPIRVLPAAGRARLNRARVWRAPLAFVAVFVVIAVVVAALVGGRIVRDWNNYIHRSIPAGQLDQKQLHLLEGRPLNLPLLRAGDQCNGGPFDQTTGWWGSGPVYLDSPISYGAVHPMLSQWAGRPGAYALMTVHVPVGYTGPVLIRARDLVTGEAFVFVGEFSAGSYAGTGSLNGTPMQQRTEAVVATGRPPAVASAGFVPWGVTAGFHVHEPGGPNNVAGRPLGSVPTICGGWQIDGAGFSETIQVPF